MTDWFSALTGFTETDYEGTRRRLKVRGSRLYSDAKGQSFGIGQLETPSLGELRLAASLSAVKLRGHLRVNNLRADVRVLHAQSDHAGSLFQVASQFNLLEMSEPSLTPEDGVAIYQHDLTQGPACAIAAGGATIYRNYFAPVKGLAGQTEQRQIDCLEDLGVLLDNSEERLWRMQNGYAMCSAPGLDLINTRLGAATYTERDALRDSIRIGIHWDVEVTSGAHVGHLVSQAFCSAMPVAYMDHPASKCEPLSRLALEAAYEATMWAGVINAGRTGNTVIFLTKLGGGVFGNPEGWIVDAMRRALDLVSDIALDVRIISYSSIAPT